MPGTPGLGRGPAIRESNRGRPQEEEMSKLQIVGTRFALALGGFRLGTVPSIKGLRREEGQTFVEYALILALISVALTGALIALRGQIQGVFTNISSDL